MASCARAQIEAKDESVGTSRFGDQYEVSYHRVLVPSRKRKRKRKRTSVGKRKAKRENIHSPIDLHGGPELLGDLCGDFVRFSVHDFHGAEKHGGEDGGPEDLVDGGLGSDSGGRGGGFDHDGAVEETIPIVTDGTVQGKTEGTHLGSTLGVPLLALRNVRGLGYQIS